MFNRDENIITQVSNLKLLVTTKVDSIIREAEETQLTLINANNMIKDLESKLKEVEAKYSKLLHDYNKSLEAYELTKTSATVTPSVVIPFDSAIHSHKSMRPITKLCRNYGKPVVKKKKSLSTQLVKRDFISCVKAVIFSSKFHQQLLTML